MLGAFMRQSDTIVADNAGAIVAAIARRRFVWRAVRCRPRHDATRVPRGRSAESEVPSWQLQVRRHSCTALPLSMTATLRCGRHRAGGRTCVPTAARRVRWRAPTEGWLFRLTNQNQHVSSSKRARGKKILAESSRPPCTARSETRVRSARVGGRHPAAAAPPPTR